MSKYLRIIILILIVFSSGGIYFQLYPTIINALIIGMSLLLFMLTENKRYYLDRYFVKLFLLLGFVGLNYVLNIKYVVTLNYLTLLSQIFSISIVIFHYNVKSINIINDLIKVFKYVIFHAILNFFVTNILTSSFTLWINHSTNYEVNSLFRLFFFNTITYGFSFIRNGGLFWEPGILQIYINLYVFFILFYTKKFKFSQLIICFLVLLSTFSTTGMFVFFLLVLNYYFKKLGKKTAIIPLTLFVFLGYVFLQNNFKDKFQGDNKVSSQARIFDTVSGTYMVFQKPIFGFGYNSKEALKLQSSNEIYSSAIKAADLSSINERGNTNSIVMSFVYFGIPLGCFLLVLFFRQTLIQNKKYLFFLINVMFCASEPLLFTNLFLLILLSGYFKFNKKRPRLVALSNMNAIQSCNFQVSKIK